MTDETPGWAKALEARLFGRLDGLDARLDRVATRAELDDLRAELTRTRIDLMDRMDRLQEALTQQQEESFVNYASSTRGQERLQSLEEQINALTRMVMRFRTRLDDLEGKQRDH